MGPGLRRFVRWSLVVALLGVLSLGVYLSTFVVSYRDLFWRDDPLEFVDVSRLSPARVAAVRRVHNIDDIRAGLRDATKSGLKVSIAGSRHSQGGQSYAENAIVLDMRDFDQIRSIDVDGMRITVESGATWDRVQRALAPRGLALQVMQSSNVFTVGGSLSADAHGRDLDVTQMVEVVESFRLMLGDGRILDVSRNRNAELFSLVMGGYGLYGVIVDATLKVTRDELYEQRSEVMDYRDFPDYFRRLTAEKEGVALLIARPSIDPRPDRFLRDLVVATWRKTGVSAGTESVPLTEETHVLRDRFAFGLSRRFDWAKELRWSLQKRFEPTLGSGRITRNNAMRPPIAPVRFLDHRSRKDTDLLQEYFVPVGSFVDFMNAIRELLLDGEANVLSATVRYVTPDATPVLAYVPGEPSFAVVLLLNVGLSEEAQLRAETMTRRLVDAALDRGGSYYLTYQLYPTTDQFQRAYPHSALAFERKRFYDPDEVFTNRFYERYGHDEARPGS